MYSVKIGQPREANTRKPGSNRKRKRSAQSQRPAASLNSPASSGRQLPQLVPAFRDRPMPSISAAVWRIKSSTVCRPIFFPSTGAKIHMRGQRRGQAADFTAAHGVGLTGDRKGPAARLADSPRGEMGTDNAVDLVHPLDDWLTPIENRPTTRSISANKR